MATDEYADEIMAKLFASLGTDGPAYVTLNTEAVNDAFADFAEATRAAQEQIRHHFGVPPPAGPPYTPPPPREVFRCAAASCSVTASYRLRYYDMVVPGNWDETVCTGHALVIGSEARQRGIKLVMYPVNEVTHQIPTTAYGTMSCCGRTPFDVDRLDKLTENPREVTCKPLRF